MCVWRRRRAGGGTQTAPLPPERKGERAEKREEGGGPYVVLWLLRPPLSPSRPHSLGGRTPQEAAGGRTSLMLLGAEGGGEAPRWGECWARRRRGIREEEAEEGEEGERVFLHPLALATEARLPWALFFAFYFVPTSRKTDSRGKRNGCERNGFPTYCTIGVRDRTHLFASEIQIASSSSTFDSGGKPLFSPVPSLLEAS